MKSVEADGNSIDEAIDSALKLLETTRDRVEIEILGSATRGLFGIGSRKARVRATLRGPLDAELAPQEEEFTPPVRPAPARSASSTAGRAAAPDHQATERALRVLQEVTQRIGVTAGVAAREEDDHIVLELTGDSTGVLIGRRGQMLDALEYIINRIVGRDEGTSTRFVVDSQGYRARRREALEDLARRMGEQAKRKKRAVTLNPMSPRDRRIVHMILRDDLSLNTKSSGKGYFRKLIIIPAGAGKVVRDDD